MNAFVSVHPNTIDIAITETWSTDAELLGVVGGFVGGEVMTGAFVVVVESPWVHLQ